MKFCGFNFFSELNKEGDEKVTEFKDIASSKLIHSGAYFQIRGTEIEIEIFSSLNLDYKINLEYKIKGLAIFNEDCFFLLDNNKIKKFNILNGILQDIAVPPSEVIIQITKTSDKLYGYNSRKVYELTPSQKLLFEFPSHQKIAKVASGIEHTAILTSNGDLFSFGTGLRGQLAQGDIISCELPTLVEALAGIKIRDVDCGAYHTIAASSFGDVYSAGWNCSGQLGIKKATSNLFNDHVKCQQVYFVPELIDIECEEHIEQVFCGNKHTILRSASGKLYSAGLNNYGQCGLGTNASEIDKFTQIPLGDKKFSFIICGYATTYLLD